MLPRDRGIGDNDVGWWTTSDHEFARCECKGRSGPKPPYDAQLVGGFSRGCCAGSAGRHVQDRPLDEPDLVESELRQSNEIIDNEAGVGRAGSRKCRG